MAAQVGFSEVRTAAQGQWGRILPALGVVLPASPRKSAPCPGCGGKDRFRFTDRHNNGEWLCGGGGDFQSSDGFGLLGHVFGWSATEQLKAVKDVLGLSHDLDDQQRDKLRQQAETQRRKLAKQVRLKEDRHRKDSNVLDAVINLEDVIKQRQHHQRVAQRTYKPQQRERMAARALHSCLVESYKEGAA